MIGFDKTLKEGIFDKVNLNINDVVYFFDGVDTHLKANCWKWLSLTNVLIIDNISHDVVKSELLGYDLTILGVDLSSSLITKVKNFHWFTGTFKETNTDFTNMGNDERDKLPMVWLSFTPTPQSVASDELSPVGYTHSFSMFFCASAYFRDFTTENHMRTRVDMLEIYVQELINTVKKSKYYETGKGLTHTIKRFPKFGAFSGKNSSSVLDSQLSAIELNISLREIKSCYC